MKKAAVYDRWLYTLGGGEQVAFGFAMMLRDLGYTTTILTHKKISKQKAESKLRVELSNITVEYLPEMSSMELSQYSEGYNVFVNTSYLDYFPNRANHGILSVFFPSKISLTPIEYIKRAFVIPSFRRFFIYPINYEGFSHDEYKKGYIYKWMGKRSSIHFNKDIASFEVTLYFRTLAFSTLEQILFYLGEQQIYPSRKMLSHTQNTISYVFCVKESKNKNFSVVLPSDEYSEQVALMKLDIWGFRYAAYNVFKRFFPKWEMRLHGGPGVTKLSDLESYDQIVTISKFSQKWIQKYWGLSSTILYPSTDTNNFKTASRKKNWIVHVGRFFVSGHCKKQLDLVKVFKTMINKKSLVDWELHFIGSVHEGEQHKRYFESVRRQSEGYPVHFHTDISFEELKKYLAQAKIYWHATGLDEDEDIRPILFEHFGITTVEAMASGCVPVVINAGGQKEIVTKESGFLWNNREELMENTLELIHNPALLMQMSTESIKRSRYFDRSKSLTRFATLLGTSMKQKESAL